MTRRSNPEGALPCRLLIVFEAFGCCTEEAGRYYNWPNYVSQRQQARARQEKPPGIGLGA
ncbi:hypothetical protein WGM54_18800 [Paenibacillus polymyxa]|uniref:hypothetical protein n=1 Tax=Paenibacillus polymyxa TaxID=1406 RepID=UPI00307DCAAD